MKTLIELYDERAIENMLGPETFRPDTVIYLYPPEAGPDKNRKKKMHEYFQKKGIEMVLRFEECSPYRSDRILKQLTDLYGKYPAIAIDVTGGTDAALFAAGMFCREKSVPAFTYSRKKNRFYDISGADFADDVECTLKYRVEDIFMMAGGTLRMGRVDNRILSKYMDVYDDFFRVYLKNRRNWNHAVTFIQRISRADYDGSYFLNVQGAYVQKAENGGRVRANPHLLKDLAKIGFLKELSIVPDESVSFTFADDQIRTWLRDVGSVLELYMYKICIDSGLFQDVVSSAVVDWDDAKGHDTVRNEIDVVATRGVVPVFISCKACEVRTEAINELAILRDRFGGKGAKAIITTTEDCCAAARHRAAQLGIAVIDREELESGKAAERLKVIMKVREQLKEEN